VVFFSIGFGIVATAWYFLYFFYWFWNLRQRGIFRIISIGFGTVATEWYFLYFFLLDLELLR
jgi:hypothetical protein